MLRLVMLCIAHRIPDRLACKRAGSISTSKMLMLPAVQPVNSPSSCITVPMHLRTLAMPSWRGGTPARPQRADPVGPATKAGSSCMQLDTTPAQDLNPQPATPCGSVGHRAVAGKLLCSTV